VFIDNSNIFLGAKRTAQELEPQAPPQAIRVYFWNLARLVENGRSKQTGVLAGSVPPGNDALWEHARRTGYSTDLLRRVEADDGRLVEQGVDEMLHLKIANAILDHNPPATLVLVTGDGSESDFGTGFPLQARRALKQGWDVEVYSWKCQLSGAFRRLAIEHPGKVKIVELDPWYERITFVKGGGSHSYVTKSGATVTIDVSERVVGKF
jgi:hypothetical protein